LEFVVECQWSLTKIVEFFKKGPHRGLIEEILVWKKSLMVELGLIWKHKTLVGGGGGGGMCWDRNLNIEENGSESNGGV
jgi:hypothetical protein